MGNRVSRKIKGFSFAALVLIGAGIWKITDSSGSNAPPISVPLQGSSSSSVPLIPSNASNTSSRISVNLGSAPIREAAEQGPLKEFVRVSSEVANSLPSRATLHEESHKDPHSASPVLLHAGMELGRVVRLIQEHPELKRDGADFYYKCSAREELPTSIRALCFSNWTALATLLGDHRGVDAAQIPSEIRELSEKLPPSFR